MHGSPLLENPAFSIGLIAAGIALLFVSILIMKRRKHICDLELSLAGHKFVDTSVGWLVFTVFLGLVAGGSHYLAEYALHIYDTTPVDRFTHGLSGMAVTAFILNINLTRGRRVYYPTAIGVSWLAFAGWEAYEWLSVMFDPATIIETSPWDLAVDLWIDTLGALAVCFVYDEYNKGNKL